ncbi:lytic murein transglycosylase [Roseovarius sp. SCSIO 43702]|uniref:lytic murein transglycosylase n=1 Tax=Roseovarius sp. SCSIO 43702 TaxID=2823043 RepID=UPI001C72F69A|nr:lytic murein transglycosylase [Roseovarius sp. SCSIO 43702]QYX56268.1 lytic murein transglycosylase [Roseovarius sp. SCSIO 43702]
MTRKRKIGAMMGAILGCSAPALAEATTASAIETSLRPIARPAQAGDAQEVSRGAVTLVSLGGVRPVLRPEDAVQPGAAIEASVSHPGFANWIRGFRGRALAAGVSARTFDRAFQGVQYNPDVVKKDRNQAEFKKEIWEYLDFAVSDSRVSNGRKMMRAHGRTLQRIEAHYGVDAEVVAAIWGMESAYGARRGDMPLISSLATLAYDGRRGRFFEKQLIAALKIIQSGDVAPNRMTGSWAGAMGHTQFIPTSYEAYAVDFTGDGRRDIWSDDPTDALASTAAYLKRFGWRKGHPWGVEVRLPRGFNAARASRSLKQNPAAWAAEGVVGIDGRPVPNYGPGSILLPAGPQGAAFMIFHNFGVIERYNKADAYVIGVGHLADRIRGGPPIQASWPRQYESTSEREKKEIQLLLKRKGFAISAVDGVVGPETTNAIVAYQKARGLATDGYPSKQLLSDLRR